MNDPRRKHRLRTFVAWSLILHAGAGVAWGLPALVSQQAASELEASKRAWSENLAKEGAKARAHAREQHVEAVRREVEGQLRQQFDKLTAAMDAARREALWKQVAAQLAERTRALAGALASADTSEQDLRNLEAELQRDLVEEMDEALTAEVAQDLAERFLAQVDGQVAPELAAWMRQQVDERIARRLREEADRLVAQQRDGARLQREAGLQAVREAQQIAQRAEQTARQDGTAAAPRLTEAGKLLAEADARMAIAQERTPDVGGSARERLGAAREALRQAQAATQAAGNQQPAAGGQPPAAGAQTAIAAARQALDAAAGALQAGDQREAAVRQELKGLAAEQLRREVELDFAAEFRGQTVPRLTPKLGQAFSEQLKQSGLTDQRLVDEVAKRAGELLAQKVPTLAAAGEPVGQRFSDLAPAAAAPVAAAAPAAQSGSIDLGLAAAKAGTATAVPSALDAQLAEGKAKLSATAKAGLGQLAGDGSRDADWVRGATGTGLADAGLADMRDRISRMAEGMRAGRLGDTGAGAGNGLGRLRQGALAGRGAGSRRDEAAYRELTAQLEGRGVVQGESWQRDGASGETARAGETAGLRPARVVGRDNAQAKIETGSTVPYAPTFKSLAFTAIPCLPGSFAIDGRAEKWQGIASQALKPERGEDRSAQSMQLGWRSDGLFCRFSVIDPDRTITKKPIASFYLADVVEVWIDSLNTKEKYRARHAGQQFWIWPDGASDDPGLAGGESVKETKNGGYRIMGLRLADLPRAATPTADGYILEFQLPARLITNADLAPGRILGFNAYVTTMSGTDWYWSAGKAVETFGQPDTWGDLLLAGADAAIALAERSDDQGRNLLVPGQPLRLRVVDGDMNLSPERRDKVMVTLKPAHGGQQIAVLEETGEASGAFEGAVSTALALGDEQPGVLPVYEGETVTVCYTDQARANGSRNVEVRLKLAFASAVVSAQRK